MLSLNVPLAERGSEKKTPEAFPYNQQDKD